MNPNKELAASRWYLHDGEGNPLEIDRSQAVALLRPVLGSDGAEIYVDVMQMRSISRGHIVERRGDEDE